MLVLVKSEIYLLFACGLGYLVFISCVRKSLIRPLYFRLPILLVYCISIAFLSPSVLVYDIAALLIVPLFAQRREQISPIYLFALLTLPNVSTRLGIGSLSLITVNATICLTVGAAFATALRSGNYKRDWSHFSTVVLVILVVTMIPSARAAGFTNILRAALEGGLVVLLPYYIISRSTRSADDVKRALVALVAVGSTLAAFAIFETRTAWPVYRVIFDHFGVVVSADANVKMRGGFLRSSGPFPEPLSFAYWLALLTMCAVACAWMFKSRAHQALIVLILLIGLFAAQSRGAFLGLACGVIVLFSISGRIAAVAKSLAVVSIAGMVVYAAALSSPTVGSIIGIRTDGTRVKDYRETLLERGLEEARKNPLLGVDLETITRNMSDLRQGEGIIDFVNSYLYIILVSGVIGLVAFITAMLWPVFEIWKARRQVPKHSLMDNAYLGGAMTAMSVMLIYNSLGSRSLMGIVICLGLAAALTRLPANRSVVDQLAQSAKPKQPAGAYST